MTLLRRQDVEAANRPIRLRNRGLQQANKTARHRLNTGTLEQVASVVDAQAQLLARHGGKAERIMRGIMPADAAQTQAFNLGLLRDHDAAVDRIVLEHHQAIEQLAQSGEPLDLREPQMLVCNQGGLAVLDLLKKFTQRLRRRQLDPQWKSVDEQSHHGLDAGDLRRTTRDRHPEHNVVAPGQPSQQDAPGSLDQGVEGDPLAARLPGQCGRERLAKREHDLFGYHRRTATIVRRHKGRLLQPR